MARRLKSLTFEVMMYPGEYQINVYEDAAKIQDGFNVSSTMMKSDAILRQQDWLIIAQIVTKLKSVLATGELF